MRALLIVTSATLLAGPAAACDLVEAPQGPGRVWVYDVEAGLLLDRFDAWARGLDGDCGINLAHDLDGQRFAWADEAGASRGVWLHLLDEEGPPRLVFRHDGRYVDLDLDGDLLAAYYETRDPETNGLTGEHVVTVNLTTGQTAAVPIHTDWLGDPFIADGYVFWDDVDRETYDHRLNVYDLRGERFIYRHTSYDEFGLGEKPRLVTGNARWLVLADREGTWIVDREAGGRQPHDRERLPFLRLDGDVAYANDFDYGSTWTRWRLPDGAAQDLDAPPKPLFRESLVNQGRVTLGVFQVNDDDAPTARPSWMLQPALTADYPIPAAGDPPTEDGFEGLPAPGLAAALIVLVSVLRLRDRSRVR